MKRAFLFFIALTMVGCSKAPRVGTQTPDFTGIDADGKVAAPGDYTGKVTVYFFWATWSQPSLDTCPHIQRLYEKYAGGAQVLGVHYNTIGNAVEFHQESGFGFRLIPDGTAIRQAFGIEEMPTIVIVGKDGKVVYSQVGFEEDDEVKIDGAVEAALSG